MSRNENMYTEAEIGEGVCRGYTEAEIGEGIKRMDIIVADQITTIVKLQKSKAENTNTDTTELDRQIRVEEAVLDGLRRERINLIDELDKAIAKRENPVTRAQVDHWWSLPEESRGEDPRGAAPNKNCFYCYKEQAWIIP